MVYWRLGRRAYDRVRLVALSESPADEAAIRILIEAIRGAAIEWIEPPQFRSRGWPALLRELPIVMRALHYGSEATGLIVVADSNDSVLHDGRHDAEPHDDCRACVLRRTADGESVRLTPIAARPRLRVVIGIATPAIEAWYLCGQKPHPSEHAWTAGGTRSYDKRTLKQAAYGTDRPSLPLVLDHATADARRLARNLQSLREMFPRGFGMLEAGIRAMEEP